jgi:S-adenosylmethionine synthetase
MKLFTSEQVSYGHPDKICDRISDALLTECLKYDKESRCAIESMIKNYDVYVLGEVTSNFNLSANASNIIYGVLNETGLNGRDYIVHLNVSQQSKDIALGTNSEVGGAGDQGMMFGYATNETPEMLPIPYVLATKALLRLKELEQTDERYSILKSDAKAQVTFDYESNMIDTFLISTQHIEEATWEQIRDLVYDVMKEVAGKYYSKDMKVFINPTGNFVIGSSFADSGLTGRKIIADTYGSACRHGGGAFSGKDPTKVDRSGAYMARLLARQVVANNMADRCEVQIAYAIGVPEPVSLSVECFGTNHVDTAEIEKFLSKYDLTPTGIINQLGLKDVDYNLTSSYGHFGKSELPWEK